MKTPKLPRPKSYTKPHPDIARELDRRTQGTGMDHAQWFALQRENFERRRSDINQKQKETLLSGNVDQRNALRIEIEEFDHDFPDGRFAVRIIPDREWKAYFDARFEDVDFLSADEIILQLAAKHGLQPPLGAEDFALLVVRLATAYGEPGFDQPRRPPGRPTKTRVHAAMFAIMEREITQGIDRGTAADIARQEALNLGIPQKDIPSTRHLGRIYSERSLELRGDTEYHRHLISLISDHIARGMDLYSAARDVSGLAAATDLAESKRLNTYELINLFKTRGSAPSPTMHQDEYRRLFLEPDPTPMERVALALIDHKKPLGFPNPNALAPFEGENPNGTSFD